MTINNMPSYANEYTYIVACEDCGEYWFYGAYNDLAKAEMVANDCEGVVLNNLEFQLIGGAIPLIFICGPRTGDAGRKTNIIKVWT